MKITNQPSGEIRISQRESIINYGNATITTFNLVNCIAIGGRFKIPDEENISGIFLTHESPQDKFILKQKLSEIKTELSKYLIDSIILFRIDESQVSKDRYSNGKNTEENIQEMISFIETLFNIKPEITNYTCDIKTFQCGKASISPSNFTTSMELISNTNLSSNNNVINTQGSNTETFEPIWLKNRSNDWVAQCPICKTISGTFINAMVHTFVCSNKNKTPSLINKPANGGRKTRKRNKSKKTRRVKK